MDVKLTCRRDSDKQHADAPDFSDEMRPRMMATLPMKYANQPYSLRQYSPRRHDQGPTGTCVANSGTRGLEIKRMILHSAGGVPDFSKHVPLSRLALYYGARELMDPPEVDRDEGTHISLAAEAIRLYGIPAEEPRPGRPVEEAWPWSDALSDLCTPPSWMAMRAAYVHKISKWAKIKSTGTQRVSDVIANLAAMNPVQIGFDVGDSWFAYQPGEILQEEKSVKGGHAVLIVGWDPSRTAFLIENSWGSGWGDDGFCLVDAEVVAGLTAYDLVAYSGGWLS